MQHRYPPSPLYDQLKEAGYSDEDIRLIWRLAHPDETEQRREGKRGRETKWTGELNGRLIMEVLELTGGIGNENRKVSAACRTLADREPWRSLVETSGTKRRPAEVLRERYTRLCMASFELWEDINTGEVFMEIRPKHKKRGGKYQN
jgi:hypothetical protein